MSAISSAPRSSSAALSDQLGLHCIPPCQSTRPGIQLRLFEELPATYEPPGCWLDGHSPVHPHFDNADKIKFWVQAIKDPLVEYIIEGCQRRLEQIGNTLILSTILPYNALWRAVISVHKYGVHYLATRRECRDIFLPALQSNPDIFSVINDFLSADSNHTRVMNYGIHRLVNSGALMVDYQSTLIPPFAISAIGIKHIAVRPQDFEGASELTLNSPSALYDLHDFSHLAVASLCPSLYGSKYFSDLIHLPSSLTALIRSPRMNTADPTPCDSDGVVFGQLLPVLFSSEVAAVQQGERTHTYISLIETLAGYVAEYLMGRCELQHLTTGKMMRVKKSISLTRLAVLVQNKSYELTASEMEQRVLTRGGPVGEIMDELDGLTPSERITFLARCRKWLFFEVSLVIRHRAHKLAYLKVAHRLLAENLCITKRDHTLLRGVLDHINYEGWENDTVVNLWQLIQSL